MLSPRRGSVEDTLASHGLLTKHYPSTPHLDVYLVNGNENSMTYGVAGSNYIKPPVTPKLSTFSTFNHHKSGTELRYHDDPNPYKVSNIDEFRIQTHDPYKTKSTNQLNMSNNNSSTDNSNSGRMSTFYKPSGGSNGVESPLSSPTHDFSSNRSSGMSRLSSNTMRSFSSSNPYENDSLKKFYPGSEASQNSGEYEIPDPDYDGSTGGSSEELPLPPITHPPRSDSSEDYSQLSISISSNSGGLSPSPIGNHENNARIAESPTKISEVERHRVESALKGRKTWIYVADSLANLYYMSKNSSSIPAQKPSASKRLSQNIDWILKYTGVPVLLFDTGETKSRDKRKIQIVLAEVGSGLALWKDVVDNLTSYQIVENDSGTIEAEDGTRRPISTFHTMHMSSDHTRVVGLSFDNADSADKFAMKVDKLTSDFANICLSGAKSKSKKKDAKLQEKSKLNTPKYVRPKKSEISQPCCFQHVSSLSSNDQKLFSSLQQFVTKRDEIGGSLTSNSPITSDISF